MKKTHFLAVLLSIAVLFGFSCKSKTVVKKLVNQNSSVSNNSETKKLDGVMYHLPKTVVQVTVPMSKATQTPGAFAKFAPCFFTEAEREGMVKAPSTKFSITPPSFTARGLPDTSETYVISTKGKYFESKSLFIEYAPGSYIMQKGEAESKNEGLEFTMKAIATAAGIAAKFAPLGQGLAIADETLKQEKLEALSAEYNCFKQVEAAGLVTGAELGRVQGASGILEIQMKKIIGIDLTPSETATLVAYDDQVANNLLKLELLKNPKDFRNEYQTAKELFKQLTILKTQRDGALYDGGKNTPPDTYKQYLERNAEAIKEHKAAFLGLKSKEVWSATVEFEPVKKVNEQYSQLLFSYSETKGVCNNGQLLEKNIPIDPPFKYSSPTEETCDNTGEAAIKTLWLKVVKNDNQAYLDDVKTATENAAGKDKSRGWFYRVPGASTVYLQSQDVGCQPKAGAAPKNSCLINSFRISDIAGAAGMIKVIVTTYEGAAGSLTTPLSGKQLARNETQIAQLGVTASVPASTAGRSSITAIMLDPTTGAMKNYKSSSSALVDKAILDDAAKAANSAIDAVDPLNKKKRELEELKTQNQINEEKKKLANTNTGNDQ